MLEAEADDFLKYTYIWRQCLNVRSYQIKGIDILMIKNHYQILLRHPKNQLINMLRSSLHNFQKQAPKEV